MTPASKRLLLLVYGSTHALVDAACATMLFGLIWRHPLSAREYLLLVIGYNVLAFAFQPLCGLVADKVDRPSTVAAVGIVLTGSSVALANWSPVAAVCCAGLGNGIFHVGGGAISLLLAPRRASAPGLFVAPGDLGIAFAAIVEGHGALAAWPFLCLLSVALLAIVCVKAPSVSSEPRPNPIKTKWPVLVGSFLLLTVVIRSLLGFTAASPWQSDQVVVLLIACAAFAGKALGGIVADSCGWLATTTAALLLSAPLLTFGRLHPALIVAGMLLFQITMPVSLAALFELLPRRPSVAFGLTCLALVVGGALAFTGWSAPLQSPYFTASAILVSAAFLFLALRWLQAGVSMDSTMRAADSV